MPSLFGIYEQADSPGIYGFFSDAATRLRQLICGLRGHRAALHFAPRRLTLRCARCGHESPGWEIGSGDVYQSAS